MERKENELFTRDAVQTMVNAFEVESIRSRELDTSLSELNQVPP